MDNELAELASKVKIKVKDVEVEVRDQKAVSDSARKRERENKKLVNLVSLLTNKLLREVTDTRNEIRARYFDCKKKNAAVAERSIGAHSWKKVDEIFPRSLEDRIVEVSGKTSKLIEDLASTTNMQSDSEHSLNSVSQDLDCTEDKISMKKLQRCELFKTKEEQEEIFANKLNKALENLNSEYDNIHKTITQENQTSVEILEVFKVSIKENLDVKDEEDVKLHRDHNEELKTCNQHASDNCSQHKETAKLNTVTTSRVQSWVKETDQQFSKLLFVQSRNSHDAIANLLHDCSNKSYQMNAAMEQNVRFMKDNFREYREAEAVIRQNKEYIQTKLSHNLENFNKTLRESEQNFSKISDSFKEQERISNRNKKYNDETFSKIGKDVEDVTDNLKKVTVNVKDFKVYKDKVDVASNDGWKDISTTSAREEEVEKNQSTKVAEADSKLSVLSNQTVQQQKEALDELAFIKKAQSEGLLGQFDTLELRISESGVECSGEVAQLKAFLDNKCKTATKSIKSFLREKNLDLNSSQHDAYHSLRNIRTSLDDLDLHLNKTLREFIEEGHEKVGVLRIEDVAPAMKIVSDYRIKVSELDRVATRLILEIEEFPRSWKQTVLFHGVPRTSRGRENVYLLGHAVCDVITKTLGVREEVVITEITRLAPGHTDHGGWPCLAVTVRDQAERMLILRRAGAMKHGHFQISENMTRTARLNWGLLSKFMMRVNQRYPATDMVLTPTHLYCDSRVFSVHGGRIVEETPFSVPLTEEFENKIRSQLRQRSKLNLDDLVAHFKL